MRLHYTCAAALTVMLWSLGHIPKSVAMLQGLKRRAKGFESWLRDGGTIRVVPLTAVAATAIVVILPVWIEFGVYKSKASQEWWRPRLLFLWIGIFLLTELYRRWFAGSSVRKWTRQWEDVEAERADVLAGVIDRLCAPLLPNGHGGMTADRVQAGLLQGIVDIAKHLTGVQPEAKLHATLRVPESRREKGKQVTYLKVASANRLAARRGWNAYPLDSPGPAQAAFKTGEVQIVPDTSAHDVRNLFEDRSYKSLVAFPVALTCAQGKRLAVVSIDATTAGVFAAERVRGGLEQAIAPYLKLIALSLVIAGKSVERARVK